ncbi:hypothetical protein DFH07DRAFT_971098 [Mycena maculata]|uniref:Uncharacterized protein n=1 Tax=Mycena maculata TaxID=230809 RepID=A0AAD7HQ33_9AGAR|nr:hypothetical protein DFH07DRAFT_971098 [Mycena maculata]
MSALYHHRRCSSAPPHYGTFPIGCRASFASAICVLLCLPHTTICAPGTLIRSLSEHISSCSCLCRASTAPPPRPCRPRKHPANAPPAFQWVWCPAPHQRDNGPLAGTASIASAVCHRVYRIYILLDISPAEGGVTLAADGLRIRCANAHPSVYPHPHILFFSFGIGGVHPRHFTHPTHCQILRCLCHRAHGGASRFVDELQATTFLRTHTLAAFALLAAMPTLHQHRAPPPRCVLRAPLGGALHLVNALHTAKPSPALHAMASLPLPLHPSQPHPSLLLHPHRASHAWALRLGAVAPLPSSTLTSPHASAAFALLAAAPVPFRCVCAVRCALLARARALRTGQHHCTDRLCTPPPCTVDVQVCACRRGGCWALQPPHVRSAFRGKDGSGAGKRCELSRAALLRSRRLPEP